VVAEVQCVYFRAAPTFGSFLPTAKNRRKPPHNSIGTDAGLLTMDAKGEEDYVAMTDSDRLENLPPEMSLDDHFSTPGKGTMSMQPTMCRPSPLHNPEIKSTIQPRSSPLHPRKPDDGTIEPAVRYQPVRRHQQPLHDLVRPANRSIVSKTATPEKPTAQHRHSHKSKPRKTLCERNGTVLAQTSEVFLSLVEPDRTLANVPLGECGVGGM